jgi:hypothetical protein
VVSSVRVWPGIPRRDWVSRTRTENTTPARVRMRVLIDGPGFGASVMQLEPLARSQPRWAELSARRSRLKPPVPRPAGRTHGPSDMLAPTAETRRELTTAADDCVSSRAGVNSRPVKTPAYQRSSGISPRVACRLLLVFVQPSSERPAQRGPRLLPSSAAAVSRPSRLLVVRRGRPVERVRKLPHAGAKRERASGSSQYGCGARGQCAGVAS